LFATLQQPTSCSAGEKHFRRILTKASRRHIPAGFRKDFIPGLSREVVDLKKDRDRRREQDPQDLEIAILNQRIADLIICDRRKAWQEKVESSKPRDNPDKHWRLIRILSGKRSGTESAHFLQHKMLLQTKSHHA
jgi:hypothetical protein